MTIPSSRDRRVLTINLMNKVINNEIFLEEFSRFYISLFQEETSHFDSNIYDAINSVFLDADEYVPLADENYKSLECKFPNFLIADEEFMKRIEVAIKKLI
ncbi:colicin immunity domain-containing protein [Noviherbaspirillum galbum]|nr:colicin immunity domain-containing protein [Noviherbaspirillum galbum]